jgi:hypothetical protein
MATGDAELTVVFTVDSEDVLQMGSLIQACEKQNFSHRWEIRKLAGESPVSKSEFFFGKDDDGHNYLIPSHMRADFYEAKRHGDADDWEQFNRLFSEYRIDGVEDYDFSDPRNQRDRETLPGVNP